MVKSLNDAGLRVVMDVVYNHTNAAGQAEKSVLDRIVPGYYHRLLEDGTLATSTCCANTATEHAMMEKLMVDSIVTWARDYKVDGFRFDLMGHHSKANMLAVRAALDALTLAHDGVDGSKIYLYGEGWNFGEVANDARFVQATQLNMDGTGIGTFNDRLRDAVRGGGPFDGDQRVNQGFASGLYTDPNGVSTMTPEEQRQKLLLAPGPDQGGPDRQPPGLRVRRPDRRHGDRRGRRLQRLPRGLHRVTRRRRSPTSRPTTTRRSSTRSPTSCPRTPRAPTAGGRRSSALSTVALGQGIPFFHAGSELLRSKSLDRNSFDSGDWFNRIFWNETDNGFGSGLPREDDNGSAWPIIRPILANTSIDPTAADIDWTDDRFADLLRIRRSSPLFQLGTAAAIQQRLTFANGGPNQIPGLIVMRISDTVGADLDRNAKSIIVIFNGSDTGQSITLADTAKGQFKLHKVQQTSDDERRPALEVHPEDRHVLRAGPHDGRLRRAPAGTPESRALMLPDPCCGGPQTVAHRSKPHRRSQYHPGPSTYPEWGSKPSRLVSGGGFALRGIMPGSRNPIVVLRHVPVNGRRHRRAHRRPAPRPQPRRRQRSLLAR